MRSLRGPRDTTAGISSAGGAGALGGSTGGGAARSTTSRRGGSDGGAAPAGSPAPGSAPCTKALAAGLSSASKRRLLGGRADGAGGVVIPGNLLVECGDLAAGVGIHYSAQHGGLPGGQAELLVVLEDRPLNDHGLQHRE